MKLIEILLNFFHFNDFDEIFDRLTRSSGNRIFLNLFLYINTFLGSKK